MVAFGPGGSGAGFGAVSAAGFCAASAAGLSTAAAPGFSPLSASGFAVSLLPAGHDAWTVGDEPAVVVDFQGMIDYARAHAH